MKVDNGYFEIDAVLGGRKLTIHEPMPGRVTLTICPGFKDYSIVVPLAELMEALKIIATPTPQQMKVHLDALAALGVDVSHIKINV